MKTATSDDEIQRYLDNYCSVSRTLTAESFDKVNQKALDDATHSIVGVLSLQMILFAKGAHLLGVRLDAFALFKSALDTLISALHLARQRAFVEATCLLRSALESACTGLHICRCPEAYEAFVNGSYQSTRSISAAKKDVSVVGELWGSLSRAAVHVNRRTHGPKFERNDEDGIWVPSVEFHFGVRPAEHSQDQLMLVLLSLVARVVARSQELALLEEDDARPGWRKIPGVSATYYGGTEQAIADRFALFLELADLVRHSSQRSQAAHREETGCAGDDRNTGAQAAVDAQSGESSDCAQ